MMRCVYLLLAIFLNQTFGHGSLNDPPSRASAWRHGFLTEPDYNDDGTNCGGFGLQWTSNGGKCGLCGDPWDAPAPRPHELGGEYGTGVIVKTYERGDEIPIMVNLTTCHKGFWQLRLCDDPSDNTQECFDRHVLLQSNGDDKFYPDGSRVYELAYKLPEDVSCEHCVVQWWYTAGNNWGSCGNGTGGLGCGLQENFRACADVKIAKASKSNILEKYPSGTDVKITKTSISDDKIIIDNSLNFKTKPFDLILALIGNTAGIKRTELSIDGTPAEVDSTDEVPRVKHETHSKITD